MSCAESKPFFIFLTNVKMDVEQYNYQPTTYIQ